MKLNSRIKKLAEQAGMGIEPRRPENNEVLSGYSESDDDFILNNQDSVLVMLEEDGLGKFAKLIVQECCNLLEKEGNGWLEFAKNPPSGYEHHVGPALFAASRLKEDAVYTLKEHFGLECAVKTEIIPDIISEENE